MKQALQGILPPDRIITPQLDDAYELTGDGARRPEILQPQRIASHNIGRPDWHNDLAKLVLDIGDAVDQAADEKARAILIRSLRRALNGEGKTT
jgi:metallo-beta-lactamase family protein